VDLFHVLPLLLLLPSQRQEGLLCHLLEHPPLLLLLLRLHLARSCCCWQLQRRLLLRGWVGPCRQVLHAGHVLGRGLTGKGGGRLLLHRGGVHGPHGTAGWCLAGHQLL
jgi:hypothetical protein